MEAKDLRRRLSDLLILGGLTLLFGAALFYVKAVLAENQLEARPYQVSKVDFDLPLPSLSASFTPPAQTPIPSLTPQEGATSSQTPVGSTPSPAVTSLDTDLTSSPENITESLPVQIQQSTIQTDENPITALPVTPASSAGPAIRLVIPHIRVDRSVVPVNMIGSGENLQWDTNALLANQNRRDLVGQLPTSVNPGDGSNIVLVGHNYNRGDSNWYGVFMNLKALTPGDRITVYTQNDGEFHYTVQEVRQVPWTQEESGGLGEHQEYLWPTPHEQLTLVTCGGVNLLRWSDRVYVVALPVVD